MGQSHDETWTESKLVDAPVWTHLIMMYSESSPSMIALTAFALSLMVPPKIVGPR